MKNNRLIYLLIGLLALWLTIISFTSPQNNTHNETININEYNVSGFSTDFTKVVEDNKDAIVTVMADGNISTGFVYSQNDDVVYIVTSYHGVASSNNIVYMLPPTLSLINRGISENLFEYVIAFISSMNSSTWFG